MQYHEEHLFDRLQNMCDRCWPQVLVVFAVAHFLGFWKNPLETTICLIILASILWDNFDVVEVRNEEEDTFPPPPQPI